MADQMAAGFLAVLPTHGGFMSSGPQHPGRERVISGGDVDIAVVEFAHPDPERPPVVLLHGIGSRGESWWPVIDQLAQHFHLWQIDMRGHGASGRPASGYAMDDYAADLEAVLTVLDLGQPRIVGHSLGALVTLFWASQHPARAAALVLEDPPLRTPPNILESFDGWMQLSSLTPAQAAAWYHQEYPDWSEEDCQRRAETITSVAGGVFSELRAEAAQALATGNTDRTHILAGVQSPALLLYGNPELGSMVAPEDVTRFRQFMPQARTRELATAGHSLHREATDEFLAAVVPFLEDPGR